MSTAPDRAPDDPRPARFAPSRAALAPVLVLFVCTVPAALSSTWLLPLLLVPLACLVWVLRARVVVGRQGLEVCNGLGVRTVPWDRVEGYDVPRRGPVRLLTGTDRVPMTALPRDRVRDLVGASESAQGLEGRTP